MRCANQPICLRVWPSADNVRCPPDGLPLLHLHGLPAPGVRLQRVDIDKTAAPAAPTDVVDAALQRHSQPELAPWPSQVPHLLKAELEAACRRHRSPVDVVAEARRRSAAAAPRKDVQSLIEHRVEKVCPRLPFAGAVQTHPARAVAADKDVVLEARAVLAPKHCEAPPDDREAVPAAHAPRRAERVRGCEVLPPTPDTVPACKRHVLALKRRRRRRAPALACATAARLMSTAVPASVARARTRARAAAHLPTAPAQ